MYGGDFTAFMVRQRDNVGDIELTLSIVIIEFRQPAFQVRAVRDQDPGIDFVNFALFISRVFMLNNANDLAILTSDTAIAGWIVEFYGQQTDTALRFGITQTLQRLNRNQRHVAVEHQNVFVVSKERCGLLHGVAGTKLLSLQYPIKRAIAEFIFEQIAAMAVNQMYTLRA